MVALVPSNNWLGQGTDIVTLLAFLAIDVGVQMQMLNMSEIV
jgi:hypothetical protein